MIILSPKWIYLDNKSLASDRSILVDGGKIVNVLSESPKVKDVRGTNNCNLYFQELKKNNDLNSYRIISVIDNLTKGASGQAVQNMNLLFDFEETLGLNNMSLYL